MSARELLERIAQWRWTVPRFDTDGLIRWYVDGRPVGWITHEVAQRLRASPLFVEGRDGPALRDDIGGPLSKTRVLAELAEQLRQEGWVWAWRDELYDFVDEWGRIRFQLERGVFRTLGLRSRAVHINGYVGGEALWLARRAESKRIDPGRLDNLAAGGIGSMETPHDCVIRELAEEAGVPRSLAMMAQPAGVVHSRRREPDGVHDELLYCYDLELPPTFAPVNCDGEVASFCLEDAAAVPDRLDEMTWDAAAVTAEWLGRWLDGEV